MNKPTLLLAHLLARQACLWAALWLLSALMFGPPPARAAVTESWVQRYNGPANLNDHATAVAVDGSGNVVVTGRSGSGPGDGYPCCPIYDYYTAKYAAADGTLLWESRYDSASTDYNDYAKAVAVDSSGNAVVTGASPGTHDSFDYFDFYTAKYAATDGTLLWERGYNGPANSGDQAQAVAVDSSGNVVVTGSSQVTGGSHDYYTAKYAAADGALLWEKRHNGSGNDQDEARAVGVDGSGNVLVTGSSTAYVGPGSVSYDYYTAKYAAGDGALLWEKRGPGGFAAALAVDGIGNLVVTGSTYNGANYDYYTAKYAAADGVLLWETRYNGPANGDDWPKVVAVDGGGNAVVTGSSYNGTNSDCYTAKYAAANGALLWERRYNGPANSDDWGQAVAVDGSANAVVTGSSYNGTNNDYYTAKYAAANGALLWEKRYNGPANGDDYPSSLALGPNGMVAVTGSSSGDYATVVYWENLPPVSIDLIPTGIRIHFTGVSGRSYNIERASAVTGPWSTLATPTASLRGLIEYVDTNPPAAAAFYRTVQP